MVTSPNRKQPNRRKRLRSLTPSESGINRGDPSYNADLLRSPLAKRKKLAADRSGMSRLKHTLSVDDFDEERPMSEVADEQGDVEQDDVDEDEGVDTNLAPTESSRVSGRGSPTGTYNNTR